MARTWVAIGILLLSAALFSAGLVRKFATLRHSETVPRKIITVIPKGVENPWWNQVRLGALAGAAGTPYRMVWTGPELESDHMRQITCIEDALTRNSAALVIAPNDSKALIRPVLRAMKSTPCVIIDSPLGKMNGLPLVGTDNSAAGELGARLAARAIGGHGRILVVNHLRNSESTEERARGFIETIRNLYPAIEIVESPFGESSLRNVRPLVTDLLIRHPGIDAIFTVNLDTSEGAYRALLNEGLAGKVRLIAFDSSALLLDGVRRGNVEAIIAQNPFEIGRRGVLRALEMLEDKAGETVTPIPVFVVNRSNLDEMIRSEPAALGL